MAAYKHTPGMVTWQNTWSLEFDMTVAQSGGASPLTRTITVSATDAHAYTTGGGTTALNGTLVDEIGDGIVSAFGATTPAVTSVSCKWLLDSAYHPQWYIEINLDDASYVEGYIEDTGDDLGQIGIRVDGSDQHAMTNKAVGQLELRSNGFTAGMWAPGPCQGPFAGTSQNVRVARNQFDAAERSIVRLGEFTRYRTPYEKVDLAHIHQDNRNIAALVTRAGMDLTGRAADAYGSLEQMVSGFANGKTGRLHIEPGTYYTIELDRDAYDTAALASDDAAGGTYQLVTMPFVKVA